MITLLIQLCFGGPDTTHLTNAEFFAGTECLTRGLDCVRDLRAEGWRRAAAEEHCLREVRP